uniref:Uncharacterized protein n=1 Tax=Sinocyclocheilus grahami TaxID=75366 RepID=A0A672L489_SINGR
MQGAMSRGAQKSHTNPSKQTASLKARGLKDIRIDEEVKIAVNIALERFQYSDEKGLSSCEHSRLKALKGIVHPKM